MWYFYPFIALLMNDAKRWHWTSSDVCIQQCCGVNDFILQFTIFTLYNYPVKMYSKDMNYFAFVETQ